ncbi:MAG: protein kinase [Byssovorax sp.]
MSRTRGFLVEAFHTEFDQRVVVRVLSPALCDEKEVERFRRESRILAKLESEYVARILDVGTLPDGAFYLARPYLEGVDLASHLKKRGPLPLPEATLLILQVAEAVSETHVHNIILRELQPSHLFLTQRLGGGPVLKLIDFGTAKLLRDAAAPTAGGEMTSTSMFGLSCYSSPELVRKAKHIDVRTDVWSIGAIFYQLLAGRPPFDGEMAALMLQISRDNPVPLSSLRRDLPREIDQIIGWAMAKDVDGRFANVHAFAHALTPYASPEGQVLIQRIGEITTAGKKRKQAAAAAVDRDHPITMDNDDLLEDVNEGEEAPTRIQSSEALAGAMAKPMPAAGQPAKDSPFESTVFMGADYVPTSPAAQGGARAVPAPAPSGPVFGGAAAGMQMPAPRPAPPSAPGTSDIGLLGPSLNLNEQPRPSWGSNQGTPSSQGFGAAAATPGIGVEPPASQAKIKQRMPTLVGTAKPQSSGQKVAIVAVAGTVALLSVVAGVVIVKGHPSETPASADSAQAATTAATTASSAVAALVPSTPPSTTADTPPPVEHDPAVTATATKVALAPSNTPQAGTTPSAKPSAKPTVTATAAPPPPATTPPDSGGMGTIVAVAVGGSCAFSVNGASKGTASTLKVQVKAGTYSVTCKPATGATKSKSVTVTSGGTAMAMFKL